MSSKRDTINDKIDKLADSAKRAAATVSDAKDRATKTAAKRANAAGKKIKHAGEVIMKKTGGR